MANHTVEGKQSFPSIDKHEPNPGQCWKKIEGIPEKLDRRALVGVLYGGGEVGFRQGLRNFGNVKIIKE